MAGATCPLFRGQDAVGVGFPLKAVKKGSASGGGQLDRIPAGMEMMGTNAGAELALSRRSNQKAHTLSCLASGPLREMERLIWVCAQRIADRYAGEFGRPEAITAMVLIQFGLCWSIIAQRS